MLKHLARYLLCLVFLISPLKGYAKDQSIPRTVILLHIVQKNAKEERIRLGQILETPLNHLGLVVEYHDILDGIPDLSKRSDVRGIVTWYDSGNFMPNPREYVKWLTRQIKEGKKVVIMEEPGFFDYAKNWPTQNDDINALFEKLGLKFTGQRTTQDFGIKIKYADAHIINFERAYDAILPAFDVGEIINDTATTHLQVSKGNDIFSLVTTNKNGGYVAEGYSLYSVETNTDSYRSWYINPFEFFRKAFSLEGVPAPDTTTIAGNRIFYSHIDGDGWNNVTQIESYKGKEKLCSEVLLDKIFRVYVDLPVTMAPIGADLDDEWAGKQESREVAQGIFALPHIEIASHTYSHPFSWEFFTDPENIEKEKDYFEYYPKGYTWKSNKGGSFWSGVSSKVKDIADKNKKKKTPSHLVIDGAFDVPRGFAHKRFNLEREVIDSCRLASDMGPEGKKTEIILWSGNTSPDEKALEMAEKIGVQNMNGGDTRFDWENYSYAWVSPKGRKVGKYWQVYTSNANETIYTHTWKDRFYSFEELIQTVENTDSPIRVSPFNIYYHSYIAEKKASLESLIHNLDYALKQDLNPIPASQYAKIVQGFYKMKLTKVSGDRWKIENRGSLDTIRFDKASLKVVDFDRSKGVIGQRHLQGSLYVSLDPSVKAPILALKNSDFFGSEVNDSTAYVFQSNWKIKDLSNSRRSTSFFTKGFGTVRMKWKVPNSGAYQIKFQRRGKVFYTTKVQVGKDRVLNIDPPVKSLSSVQVKITYKGGKHV